MTDFSKIMTLKNEIEAQVLTEALRERNIPHVVRSFHDSAYDGIFQMQKGWGVLMAPESFRADIETILKELNTA